MFYVPGMISLLALPFLILNFDPLPPFQTLLSLFVPDDRKSNKPYWVRYTTEGVKQSIRNKKKLEIAFTDDYLLNERKLSVIQADAERLQYYNDTTTVIKVNFSEEMIYGDFIRLLSALRKSGIRRYAWIDDSLIIFGG